MVRHIYVVKGNRPRKYDQPISWIGDSHSKIPSVYLEMFDDLTNNFDDLGFWNCEENLHGLNAHIVAKNVQHSLDQLHLAGHSSYAQIVEPDEFMYTWEFGRRRVGTSIITEDMEHHERCAILVYHLDNLLQVAKEYDEEHYFFIS